MYGINPGCSTRDLPLDLTAPIDAFWAHTHAAWYLIVYVAPIQVPSNILIGGLDGLSADDNSASSAFLPLVGELLSMGLSTSTHEVSHSWEDLANNIIVVVIVVLDLESQLLDFLKEIWNLDCGFPVWIMIVVELLSLTNLYPFAIALLVHLALRIRLAHEIESL